MLPIVAAFAEDTRVIAEDAPQYNATLVKRVDHSADLASVWVRFDGEPVPFEPGQYMTIGVFADDKLWQRPYSVASAPSVAGTEGYEFYVRLVPIIRFTTLLWRLQPGARMRMIGPKGKFMLEPSDNRTHLYVSTGTGLAPFMAMIRETQAQGKPRKTVVLHGVSHASDLGYREELEAMERDGSYPVRYVPTISRPGEPRNAGWAGRTEPGRGCWRCSIWCMPGGTSFPPPRSTALSSAVSTTRRPGGSSSTTTASSAATARPPAPRTCASTRR